VPRTLENRFAKRLAAILVTSTLVLGACSGDDDKNKTTSPTVPTSPAPTTSTTTPKTATTKKRATPTTRKPTAATAPPTTVAPNISAARVITQQVAAGLDSPVAVAWRKGDARMFVAEQHGRVRIVDNGRLLPTPVVTIPVSTGNEQGLLGIAFSPDGTKLYVDYTDPAGDSHVDEYTMSGNVATSRRQILIQDQPYPNHNGGEVLTGPDGMLYIGFGDGGSAGDPNGNGQKLNTWLGKILRINPRKQGSAPYTVPANNPFVGRSGARAEIWMWGLRNPWRFSFDRATGAMWIGDVGQNVYEEIDVARAGEKGINWGWNAREALHEFRGGRPAGARDPVLEINHNDGSCAVVGGYVYRGNSIPALKGAYVFGDNCRPGLVALTTGNGVTRRELGVSVQGLTSFGEAPNGELYAVARGGNIYRLAAA
jgi:glucose/arabinose dehydrogenase